MIVKIFIGYPQPKNLQEIPQGLISHKHKGKSYMGIFLETDRVSLRHLREHFDCINAQIEHLPQVNTQHPILFCDLFLGG